MLEDRFIALLLELASLAGSHLVDGLAHVGGHVEAVQHVHSAGCLACDDLQIGLPHVAADELQPLRPGLSELPEEHQQRLLLSVLAHPEQAPNPAVNLVHHRQELVPTLPKHLVHADGSDTFEVAMREAPVDGHLHRAKHRVPRRVKRDSDLLPAQPLGPAGEKPRVGLRHALLAVRPRHGFDHHAAARAVHAPHRVHQVHEDAPERHESELTGLQPVVTGPLLQTLRAAPAAATMGPNLNAQREMFALREPLDAAIHESGLAMNAIEDSLELHP